MLKVESISFGFAHLPLFSGVSLEINRGDLLHVTGPNGVGKSTLIQILAGIVEPNSGQISVRMDSQEITDRREVCEYLPSEGNGLFLRRDAVSNLLYWSPLRGRLLSKQEADAELMHWGLTKRYFREGFPVGKFSTGMKRRLALARIAISGVPIWLLDEPIYGLDQSAIELFRTRIRTHLDGGGAAVIISHDLSLFEGFAPREFALTSSISTRGTA